MPGGQGFKSLLNLEVSSSVIRAPGFFKDNLMIHSHQSRNTVFTTESVGNIGKAVIYCIQNTASEAYFAVWQLTVNQN